VNLEEIDKVVLSNGPAMHENDKEQQQYRNNLLRVILISFM